MDKKKPILQLLLAYAGKRKVLTYLSMVISGISQLLALVPFLYIWAILRDVIAGDYRRIAHYGWMAVAFAIATIIVYFGALMCSHLAAFRIAANMRKALMRHIMTLPIGFLDALGSGKVRKWVQESTQSTETYLAHQLPDKAGMYATMIGLAVLMFLFDWRMGLLCLGTVLLAIIVMITLMTGPTLRSKLGEYNKALDAMSNEAVEYVRGIPVVKTFGQSVFSFKRFKESIDQYKQWVIAYTIDLRRPMTLYTTLVNASFAVLISLTLIVVKNGTYSPEFLLNLLYYIIVTPAIAVTLNRIMFASENEMIVADALDKTGRILSIDPLSDPSDAKLPDH
ncbi:MAG: ABC transporter ATP-binding protein/permease [Bacteroidales bacterium]|nr:ABC transporter ATP-binding protein/permease [Bacteroidales bacterium]